MKSLAHVTAIVSALAEALPVEDIWYFEAGGANECEFAKPFQLVLFVREGAEFHKVEAQANEMIRRQRADISAHAFPHAAIYQTPRPLVVKMAFSVGECVYQR
jgi:hypothetical protein